MVADGVSRQGIIIIELVIEIGKVYNEMNGFLFAKIVKQCVFRGAANSNTTMCNFTLFLLCCPLNVKLFMFALLQTHISSKIFMKLSTVYISCSQHFSVSSMEARSVLITELLWYILLPFTNLVSLANHILID